MSGDAEDFESLARVPINVVGVGAEGLGGAAEDSEDHGGGGGEVSQPLREAWTAGPVAVLIPPAVLQKEDAVLDLPVIADRREELLGGDRTGIDAGHEVARIGQPHCAIVGDDVAVHAQRDLAAGKAQRLADVFGVG